MAVATDDYVLERVKLISEPDFRLIRLELADGHVEHVLETRDGCDAMGAERWRKFIVNGDGNKALFKYLVRLAEKEQ